MRNFVDSESSKIVLNPGVTKIFETPPNKSFKFGYYNITPISADGTKLLAHKINFEGRLPKAYDKVEIGYFLLSDGSWNKLASTNAFNWQQGSMLQWLGPDFNNRIIFNDADITKNRYISRIINIITKEEKTIPHAIYGVHPSGNFSISLNFERCNFTRAYSYASIINEYWNKPIPHKDGIKKVNLVTGEAQTIIKLEDIIKFQPVTELDNTPHWFEHIMLNPSGSRFSFYHRYQLENGFATRAFTADHDGNNLWLHPNKSRENLSHLGWKNDSEYVLFTIPKSKLHANWVRNSSKRKTKWYIKLYRKALKPFMPRIIVRSIPKPSSSYVLTRDQKDIINHINLEPKGMDGHPSFTRCERFMLSDTYADKDGYRNLILHDFKTNQTRLLGRFYSVYNNCSWRADLHPRFSPDEKSVLIDTNHQGTSQILMLKLDWVELFNEHK